MAVMYVHIHCSKFYKSRLVTFNEHVSRLMQEILQWRSTQKCPMVEDSYVFINRKGKPVNLVSLHQIFATIRKNAGLYFPDRGRHQPRIHDLRYPNKNKIQTFDILYHCWALSPS